MAKNKYSPFVPTANIAQYVDQTVKSLEGTRKSFERRWYNNNFFDDGFHYRFVSRTTGRVVDLSASSESFMPYRAIPKSSRQIRGIANLLVANEPTPIVYPEKVNSSNEADPNYEMQMKQAKDTAKKVSYWIKDYWKELDLKGLLTQMVILTCKHGVSYLQVWSDPVEEAVRCSVWDAFDIYLNGSLTNIQDCPIIVKTGPMTISEIKANEEFEKNQLDKIAADNKYASSEIKEAYMLSRYGNQRPRDEFASLILKEAFIKEYINNENKDKVAGDLGDKYKGRKNGDPIIRQVFSAGGVWLKDEYIALEEYPFVDLRLEPGPIYQVPLIERFIPANKVLDSVMSRVERHIGTMAVGIYQKRRGENFEINNVAGGQIIEYDQTPLAQMQTTQLGQYVFQFIREINDIIEEQGSTTSALGQVPPGVKSGVAIESLKATEYANLKIATNQVKKCVEKISQKMIVIASENFISPQTVYRVEDGQPAYFDVIGEKGLNKYQELADKEMAVMPDAVPLKKDYKVEIEVESGLGYTTEGKRNSMIQIIEYMRGLAAEGYLTQEAVAQVVKKFLEVFQFGSVGEFMEAMEQGTPPVTNKQIQEMKVAFMEVIKDLQGASEPQEPPQSTGVEQPVQNDDDRDILKIKTGLMEAMSDIKQAGGEQGGQIL